MERRAAGRYTRRLLLLLLHAASTLWPRSACAAFFAAKDEELIRECMRTENCFLARVIRCRGT